MSMHGRPALIVFSLAVAGAVLAGCAGASSAPKSAATAGQGSPGVDTHGAGVSSAAIEAAPERRAFTSRDQLRPRRRDDRTGIPARHPRRHRHPRRAEGTRLADLRQRLEHGREPGRVRRIFVRVRSGRRRRRLRRRAACRATSSRRSCAGSTSSARWRRNPKNWSGRDRREREPLRPHRQPESRGDIPPHASFARRQHRGHPPGPRPALRRRGRHRAAERPGGLSRRPGHLRNADRRAEPPGRPAAGPKRRIRTPSSGR